MSTSSGHFDRFCDLRGFGSAAGADEAVVLEYVADQVERGLVMATIHRRLAAITHYFALQGLSSPAATDVVRRARRNAARRTSGARRRQAAPLRLAELFDFLVRLRILRPNHPATGRDRLLVGLGWAAALRASELVALDVDDLTHVGDPDRGDGGVLVRIRRSKTDQTSRVEHVAVSYARNLSLCPARMALRWCAAHRSGPLFRRIDRHGHAAGRLGPTAVTPLLRRLIAELLVVDGLPVDPDPYSSHSLRAGFVTEARAHEVPDARIARHTTAGDRCGGILDVYDRPHTLFERPALDPSWW